MLKLTLRWAFLNVLKVTKTKAAGETHTWLVSNLKTVSLPTVTSQRGQSPKGLETFQLLSESSRDCISSYVCVS